MKRICMAVFVIAISVFVFGDQVVRNSQYEAEYRISGSAKTVMVTLFDEQGNMEQHNNVQLPKRYQYRRFDSSIMSITVQNKGDRGYIVIQIYVDGELVKEAEATGAYTIANASHFK